MVLLGRVRKHVAGGKWKFIQMAAEVDLSWPFDHCGTGVCDLRSERSRICGAVAGIASVSTSTHRKTEGGIRCKAVKNQRVNESN